MRMLSVAPMTTVFEDMDRLMETFTRGALDQRTGFKPEADLHELDDHFIASFDIPGVKRENLKVEVRGQQLSISSERQRPWKEVEKFERVFALPTSIDKEKIEVQYEDGVLNLLLPKAQAAKPRTIEIQSAPQGQSFFSRFLASAKSETSGQSSAKPQDMN